MRWGVRSCCAAIWSATATATAGVIGTALLAARVKDICTSITGALTRLSGAAGNTTAALSSLFSALSSASATTSSALGVLSSGASAAASSTTAILTTLARTASQVGPSLLALNQTTLHVPLNVDGLLSTPAIPIATIPPVVIPSSTIPFHVANMFTVPISELLAPVATEAMTTLAADSQQVSQLLGAVGETVGQSTGQVCQLLTQLGGQIDQAGTAAAHVSEFVDTIGSQVGQLGGEVVQLPAICTGVSFALGLSLTLLAAGVVGLVVYLCVRHCEESQ